MKRKRKVKVDPIGINNVCFSLANDLNPKDDRQKSWKKQRLTRGFDSTELWNLDTTIAKFILPRLVAFRDNQLEMRIVDENDKWIINLNKMISAFELLTTGEVIFQKSDTKVIQSGLKSFATYYNALWN